MGDLNPFSRPESPSPEALPGTEFLLPMLQAMSGGLPGQVQGAVSGGQNKIAPFLQALTSGFPAFQQGLQTGFTPGVVPGLSAALMPELMMAKERATGDVLGTAGALGTLTGSGTTRSLADMNMALESGMLRQLGEAGGKAALQGQGIQGQLAGMGSPTAAGGAAQGLIGLGSQLPMQLMQMIISGASGAPFSQPTVGPSKVEALAGPAATIGASMIGGPAAGAAVGSATSGKGGGGGGGGGGTSK